MSSTPYGLNLLLVNEVYQCGVGKMVSDDFPPAPVSRRRRPRMRIVDSHFHWWPRSVWDALCERKTYPRAERDGKGGYRYFRTPGVAVDRRSSPWPEWFDLDKQFEHMDALGHDDRRVRLDRAVLGALLRPAGVRRQRSRDPVERRDGRRA